MARVVVMVRRTEARDAPGHASCFGAMLRVARSAREFDARDANARAPNVERAAPLNKKVPFRQFFC